MKTYNIELKFNNDSTKQFWIDTLSIQRDCYNFISELVFKEKPILAIKVFHDKYYNLMKENFNLPSQILIKTEREVLSTYRAIASNKHKLSSFAEKKSSCLRLDKRLYSNFNKDSISLTSELKNHRTTANLMNYVKSLEMFSKYVFHDPLIFYKDNRFFLSVSFDIPEIPVQNNEILGIDLGCRRLFTTSDGDALLGKEYLKNKRKIRYLKRKLQSKKSKNAKLHLKKLSKKESNFSKNYIHHEVNQLLKTDKSILVIEDLTKIKENTKKNYGSHNNRLSQIPFYMFKQILSYKAPLVGKRVATVNPAFTSQIDSQSGVKSGSRKGRRFQSDSGTVYDADWNAAINIANKFAKHPISCELPIDGRLHLLGRLL